MINMSIYYPNENFDFTKIKLSNPNGVQGGSYFCKLSYDDDELLIQTPKISTKSGILTTGKKIYTDLQLTKDHSEFILWLDNLERYLQNLIYKKKDIWFQNELSLDDIEYFFNKTYRSYKNTNYLVRSFVKQSKNFKNIETFTIYNEKEDLLSINELTKDNKIISIIEIAGVKFTNTEFRVEINLKQVMVFQNTLAFNRCLIKSGSTQTKEDDEPIPDGIHTTDFSDESRQTTQENVDINKVDDKNVLYNIEGLHDTVNDELELDINEEIELHEEEQQQPTEKSDDIHETKYLEDVLHIQDKQNIPISTIDEKGNEETKKPIVEVNSQSSHPENIVETIKTKHVNVVERNENNNNHLEEISLDIPENLNTITLKKPIDIYLELYNEVLAKAKLAKENALKGFLEAKQIKNKYLLDSVETLENETVLLESLTEDSSI